ncbi:MAG: SLBB domain-containing protein, partial [Chitinophagaceae bacterium]|nr:SLBB domain-containing protein [Chitinophagaceae bacterium]
FDVKDNETAADIIQYAGGFADHALKEWIRVYRMGQRTKEIVSVPYSQLNQFKLNSGDPLVIDSLANTYANRVMIGGAVYYGGAYSIAQIPTLKALLEIAKPREDVFVERGIIKRLKKDFTPEIISFNVNDIVAGKNNIDLQREDSVQLFRINELREKFYVTINGEVNKPGIIAFAENTRVQDLVLMAGGYRDGASLQRIEVSRRIRQQGASKDSALYSVIKTIDLSSANNQDLDFVLQPFDMVSVRKSPLYKEQINVGIEGEIVFPGNYTLSGNTERISDLVKRAGGLKQNGFAGGALLIRKTYRDISETDATLISNKTNLINRQSGINTGSNGAADSTALAAANKEQKPVGIRLDEILANPGSAEDLFLLEGDILKIPRQLQTIQTFGAVNVPKQIVYYEGIRFKDALRESGRFSMNASRKNSYVIYPNGQVRKTRNFLFVRFYPAIKPGTEIYVPAQKPKGKLSTGEVIGVVSSLTSLVSILVLLINSQK